MCNVKPEFYEATTTGGSTRGLMVYTGLAIFLRLRMDKYAETDFTRFLYSVGSEASSENKKNIQKLKAEQY